MRIDAMQVGDVTVLDLNGRLLWSDGDSVLRQAVGQLLSSGRNKLVLNLRGVSCMDCGGLGVLVEQVVAARHLGGQVKLASPMRAVRHVLAISRIVAVIEIFESRADAVLSFLAAAEPSEAKPVCSSS